MPIYEYRCRACGHEFDKLQRMDADAPPCAQCGEDATERKVSLSSFRLKGSGWYKTDYAAPASGGAESGSGGSDGASSGGSDSASTASDASASTSKSSSGSGDSSANADG